MPKKVVIKKTSSPPLASPKRVIIQKRPISQPSNVEKTLVENFVGLQKVMTDLVMKLDSVSNQIIQLLNIFEVSAKTLAEKGGIQQGGIVEKQILEKIDNLIDQNRTIARGVSLLHNQEPQQSPPQQSYESNNQENSGERPYQKSISSKPQPFNITKRM